MGGFCVQWTEAEVMWKRADQEEGKSVWKSSWVWVDESDANPSLVR